MNEVWRQIQDDPTTIFFITTMLVFAVSSMLTYSGWRRYINRHYAPDLPSMFDVGRMKGGLLMLSMLANKIEKKMPLMLKMGIIFNRILFITLICALAYLAFSTWTTTR